MPIASPKATFSLKTETSRRLCKLIGLEGGKIFYTVSGAESVENALKIARQITGKKIILARQKSYHGASLGALSVTGDWRNRPHLTFDEGTVRIPEHADDPDLSQTSQIIRRTGSESIASVILETISGTNGMSVPNREWMTGIQALCRKHRLMLIIDEVLVGFGRCGPPFAFHDYGLVPDLVCMSKAISGGYVPFGAVWTSPAIAQHYENEVLSCGLTSYGHPLGLAALEAVLDTLLDRDFQTHKSRLETRFALRIGALQNMLGVTETRCRGLLAAVYFDRPAPSWQSAFDRGLHLFASDRFNILAPPYVSSIERLDQAMDVYQSLLE
jgi:taurine--2-oxoglutarate transaminase